MEDTNLLISEKEAKLLDDLLDRVKHTKYGLITNWNDPYGITFESLKTHIDIIKYGEKYVRQKEYEKARQKLDNY